MKRRSKRRLRPIAFEALPRVQALLIPVVARAFEELQISVSFRLDDGAWHAVHLSPNVVLFEGVHGVENARWAYNERCFPLNAGVRKVVLGEHAGFHDFFVPVTCGGSRATIVAGPFAKTRATSGEVLERWRAITGNLGRLSDPGFSQYLAMTLSTLTLEGPLLDDFRRLLECFSRMLGDESSAERLAAEVTPLIARLGRARDAERMWAAVETMVDLRTSRSWMSRARLKALGELGLTRVPDHAVVGLLVSSDDSTDPVQDAIRRDAFQRACVKFAIERGGVVAGRLGDHGVVLLTEDAGKGARQRAKLLELARRALALARRFGLRLHAGVSSTDEPATLPVRYRDALAAAQRALYAGAATEVARPSIARPESPLGDLRKQLVQAASETPQRIAPIFARFVEAAATHSGYRLESTRAHLEAGFDQMTDALRSTGNLDERSLAELGLELSRRASAANTVRELAAAYEPAITGLEQALERPIEAGQDRAMRRAIEFVREHLNEPLPLAKVARIAGYAPRYFAKLFVRDERMTLQDYVTKLRLARAQQLLMGTALTIQHVQGLSGFRTRVHFHRAFKQAFGVTPGEFREQSPP